MWQCECEAGKVDNNVRYIFQAESGTIDGGYLVGHVWPGVWPPALAALPLLPGGPSLGPRSEPHPTGYSRPAPAPATLRILEHGGK